MATSTPGSGSELQLYRLLQRANLLQYYDTFIAQGGDDIQQLCEAGEDEFLEIMALVGMASKPLHVRRLQKALQEYAANPAVFKSPTASYSIKPASGSVLHLIHQAAAAAATAGVYPSPNILASWTPEVKEETSSSSPSGANHSPEVSTKLNAIAASLSTSPPMNEAGSKSVTDGALREALNRKCISPSQPYMNEQVMNLSPNKPEIKMNFDDGSRRAISPPLTLLSEYQISAIASAAYKLSQVLPTFHPKPQSAKKQICKEIECVMNMDPDDPSRMEQLRKYASIYGRFDSKRKNEKPMTLHEISVNEAAAQLCRHIPALLTRREELFPLARQVVRDSGYQYAKGHSRAQFAEGSKKAKGEEEIKQLEERLMNINTSLSEVTLKMTTIKQKLEDARKPPGVQTSTVQGLKVELQALTAGMLQLQAEQKELQHKHRIHRRHLSNSNSWQGSYPRKSSPENNGTNSPSSIYEAELQFLRQQAAQNISSSRSGALKPGGKEGISASSVLLQQVSLYEEGLRIAEQYGMADFAKELIGMKSDENEEEESDTMKEDEVLNLKTSGNAPKSVTNHSSGNNDEKDFNKSLVVPSQDSDEKIVKNGFDESDKQSCNLSILSEDDSGNAESVGESDDDKTEVNVIKPAKRLCVESSVESDIEGEIKSEQNCSIDANENAMESECSVMNEAGVEPALSSRPRRKRKRSFRY